MKTLTTILAILALVGLGCESGGGGSDECRPKKGDSCICVGWGEPKGLCEVWGWL
jgi:hypothetical protein